MEPNLPQDIFSLIPLLDRKSFNLSTYEKTGLFIVRNHIPEDIILKWQTLWENFYQTTVQHRKVDQANPVNISQQPEGELGELYLNQHIINLAKKIYGDNVALYNHRFVIKDKLNTNRVMLHQDSCYHLGNLNKCSLFIPLSHTGPHNGGLEFYPGTHKYGYLGDAGEINPNAFSHKWKKVSPDTYPGDIIVMNSHLWHESPPNLSNQDRIVVDIIIQPSNDPTGEVLLSGEWKTKLRYSKNNPPQYFKNSRILKLKNNNL
jgi:ectoine hydroxylase-related dioxygenase (phytanoyl-CoA dioxygenase family)